ncbi:MAG: hypothetical protein Q9167_004175 [Letrouitia subvulpina]
MSTQFFSQIYTNSFLQPFSLLTCTKTPGFALWNSCYHHSWSRSVSHELNWVLAQLEAYAASDSPKRRFSPKDAAAAARSIRRHVTDCSEKTKALEAELLKSTEDNNRYRFHAAIGDYAEAVCDAIKKNRYARSLEESWDDIVCTLDEQKKEDATQGTSSKV